MNDRTCICEPVLSVVEISGVPIHALSPQAALARVEAMLKCPATHAVNHIPADPIVIARRDPDFCEALRRADLNLPDGMGVVWAARVLGIEDSKERVYGPDFMLKVMEWGVERGIRHALVGGTPSTLGYLVRALKHKVNDVDIVAVHSPPLRSVTQDGVQEDLSNIDNECDIIWVGLGTPKQQTWADLARHMNSARIILTVGAAFDFLAGTKSQAPTWMQRQGLEWLFRLRREPRRLWRRYLIGNLVFIWSVGVERGRQQGTANRKI